MLSPVDLGRAVRSNPIYARRLRWIPRYPQISHVLGFSTMSPGPEAFAQALARWQGKKPTLKSDGILGPNTWAHLEPATAFSFDPAAVRPPKWLTKRRPKRERLEEPVSPDDDAIRQLLDDYCASDIKRTELIAALQPRPEENAEIILEAVQAAHRSETARFITLADGSNVLIELSNGKWRHDLRYKKKTGALSSVYYRVGDLYRFRELEARQAEQQYPNSFSETEVTLADVALAYLGAEKPKYAFALSIDKIHTGDDGQGWLSGTWNMILYGATASEITIVELEDRLTYLPLQEIHFSYTMSDHIHFGAMNMMLAVTAAIAEIGLSGASALGKRAAGKALKRAFLKRGGKVAARVVERRALRICASTMVTDRFLPAALAFGKAFYASYGQRGLDLAQLKDGRTSLIREPGVEQALTAGLIAFLKHLLMGSTEQHIQADRLHILSASVLRAMVSGSSEVLAKLIGAAATEASRGEYSTQSAKAEDVFAKSFQSGAGEILKSAVKDAVASGIAD